MGTAKTEVATGLASARGERVQTSNIDLASAIVAARDTKAVEELIAILASGKTAQQGDVIKVLYEIGERSATLIAPYLDVFATLLQSKNQRLVWGSMCALDTIAAKNPKALAPHIDAVLRAAKGESVIARDHAVAILASLTTLPHVRDRATRELLKMVREAPINQLPMYAERAATAIGNTDAHALRSVIESRMPTVEQPAKQKRLQKVLNQLTK